MILRFSILFYLFLSLPQLYAGDDPCSATRIVAQDRFINFNNLGNSDSGIKSPPFGDYQGVDIWFTFEFQDSAILFIDPVSLLNPAVAIYESISGCSDLKLLYNITGNTCADRNGIALNLSNLEKGRTYYMRVWAEGGGPNGDFNLFYNENAFTIPQLNTFGDSRYISDDEILLTGDFRSQEGCAYFSVPMDFSEVIDLEFDIYISPNNSNSPTVGGDGICLIFQSLDPSNCGVRGAGIGAQGINESFIVEFDTYRNRALFDILEDHAAININGNMNHQFSIEGPVPLPVNNLEDGTYYPIRFLWDPTSNLYTVFFNNIEILSGNFDIIDQCFNGQEQAWFGFSSATGAETGEHRVRLNLDEYNLGTQDYEEVSICAGDNYLGLTEAGFHRIITSLPNACNHQQNILLSVISDTTRIQDTFCLGTAYDFNGDSISSPGNYTAILTNSIGCDSVVDLELVAAVEDTLFVTQEICTGGFAVFRGDTFVRTGKYILNESSSAFCDSVFVFDLNVLNSLYNESTASICFGDSIKWNGSWFSETGIYTDTLTAALGCDSIIVLELNVSDQLSWDAFGLASGDSVLDCNRPNSFVRLENISQAYELTWEKDGSFFSDQFNILIDAAGDYTLLLKDTIGCQIDTNFTFAMDTTTPDFEISLLNISCDDSIGRLELMSNDSIVGIDWSGPNQFSSSGFRIETSIAGVYNVRLTGANGCISQDSIMLNENLDGPEVSILNGDTIQIEDSNTVRIEISLEEENLLHAAWVSDPNFSCFNPYCTVAEITTVPSGLYFYEATNNYGCVSRDSIYILNIPSANIFIPNVFSPNNDQLNDYFTVYSDRESEITIDVMQIFDRWGNLLIEIRDFPSNEEPLGWDGRANGQLIAPQVLAYRIVVRLPNGRQQTYIGDFTLVR